MRRSDQFLIWSLGHNHLLCRRKLEQAEGTDEAGAGSFRSGLRIALGLGFVG